MAGVGIGMISRLEATLEVQDGRLRIVSVGDFHIAPQFREGEVSQDTIHRMQACCKETPGETTRLRVHTVSPMHIGCRRSSISTRRIRIRSGNVIVVLGGECSEPGGERSKTDLVSLPGLTPRWRGRSSTSHRFLYWTWPMLSVR